MKQGAGTLWARAMGTEFRATADGAKKKREFQRAGPAGPYFAAGKDLFTQGVARRPRIGCPHSQGRWAAWVGQVIPGGSRVRRPAGDSAGEASGNGVPLFKAKRVPTSVYERPTPQPLGKNFARVLALWHW